nr:hypothetical protein [Tanacetum cinerariifolium]
MTESPLVDSGLAVPVFFSRHDPITYLNKAMVFLTVVASSRFPSTNNLLRTSSNPRNQATIQDGRVIVQHVQGRQVDACKNSKEMWERIKRLMFGSDVTSHVRHSRLMDEFDKFATKEEESLESMYERLTTLVNIMDHNNVRHIPISINTKFLNCLQPEWSKYVTMCYNYNEKGHYACDCQKPRVRDAKYFREEMLLAMTDEAGSNLNNEDNDFMLYTSYGEEKNGRVNCNIHVDGSHSTNG